MPKSHLQVLNDPAVRAALNQAWHDSAPGVATGHEEGGFIVREADESLSVLRWSHGEQDTILVPPHEGCQIAGKEIIATFHTHPNTGDDYLQEPSETDKRAVRDDPDLKGASYVGEFVISQETIFLIKPTGQVRELAETETILTGKGE